MPYPECMQESLNRVETTRARRLKEIVPRMSLTEKQQVLEGFHPDYRAESFRALSVGANKGDRVPHELADLLESRSRIEPDAFNLDRIDYDTDVLILGGGGAGTAAALTAQEHGARVLLATKLRWGDSNTIMAQGGIQAADKENDSPARHYVDLVGGGGFVNVSELARALVTDAPGIIRWLEQLGVMFDKEPDGTMRTVHGGGTSRKRMHSCRDYTGMEIMRVLRDEARDRGVRVLEFSPAVELLLDDSGQCAGAVLYDLETEEYFLARARCTIISTGGMGRLHVQQFPTTNHYGATADGIVLAYRAGAQLIFMDTVQYHPTGVAYPEQILGQLVTEKVRGLGAQLVNVEGEQFVNELETRDLVSAAIIRECTERTRGVVTPTGMAGVWLDTPMIDIRRGSGTTARAVPAMVRQYARYGIDIAQQPILVYPTQHYQNGGVVINDRAETNIPGLFVAGEASGGVHGRNRLMGNSLLDILVFGRRAGKNAALKAPSVSLGPPLLQHVVDYNQTLAVAGRGDHRVAPMILPDYTSSLSKIRRKGSVPVA
jgi:succinate dehydrogenase / fumarate reductase flavoprotein subunit